MKNKGNTELHTIYRDSFKKGWLDNKNHENDTRK